MSENIKASISQGGISSDALAEYRVFKQRGGETYKILINFKKEVPLEKLKSRLSLGIQEVSARFRISDFPSDTFRQDSPYNGGFRVEDDILEHGPERGIKAAIYTKGNSLKAIRISPFDPHNGDDVSLADFIFENIFRDSDESFERTGRSRQEFP